MSVLDARNYLLFLKWSLLGVKKLNRASTRFVSFTGLI